MTEKPVNIDKKYNLTNYVSGMLGVRLSKLPPNMQEEMIRDAEALSAIGVDSEEDHKDFMYVLLHTRKIAEDISEHRLNAKVVSKLSNIVYSNRISNPIDTIFNFYRAVSKGLKEMGIPIKKIAYPLGQSGLLAKTPRNVRKWMKSMHEIYLMVHHGEVYNSAFSHVTAEWDVMEKNDFEHWLGFYQEGAHEKYITASKEDDDASYLQFGGDGAPMIPFSALTGTLPRGKSLMPNMSRIQQRKVEEDEADEQAAADAEAERLEARDKKVKSISGRLRSTLKLLSDEDVQEALDGKLDCSVTDFVKQIQELQRYIMLIPLKNKQSSTLEDLIVQRGNKLIAQGFPVAGDLIRKLAQDVPMGAEQDLGEDVGDPPSVEDLEGGAPEAIPDEMADLGSELDVAPDFEDETEWVQKFKDNLNNLDDKSSVEDISLVDDLVEFTVEAQALPMEEPPPADMAPNDEVTMEVEEEPELEVEEEPDPTDPAMDFAPEGQEGGASTQVTDSLENVTIQDVVDRLERVSNILKNREIPRELAWIDFMLDKLGLASYFPALAEATKSALESNQYMSSRVEDIVSRLRGSIKPDEPIELGTTEPEEEATTDTLNKVRQSLKTNEQNERAKKEQKQKGMEEEGVPPTAIPEELQQPLDVETAQPTPVRPGPRPAPVR